MGDGGAVTRVRSVCVCIPQLERDRNGHEIDLHPAFATEGHTRARRDRPSCEPARASSAAFANNYNNNNNNNYAGAPTGALLQLPSVYTNIDFPVRLIYWPPREPGATHNTACVHRVVVFSPGFFPLLFHRP